MRDPAELQEKSRELRQTLFEMVVRSGRGHVPSSFSCLEMVIAAYYGGFLDLKPKEPDNPERDRFFVSKGHAAMVLYPVLADLGFFGKDQLETFCQPHALLRMYADHTIPGIEAITGSLGHGFGIAAGHALAMKLDASKQKAWVIIGDGECYEGSIWETAMFAAQRKLDNLICIVDRNRQCILGDTEDLVGLEPLDDKWRAFGWETVRINGHSYAEILPAYTAAVAADHGKPIAIIADTVKGKGISFMEGKHLWHNRMPDEAQAQQARTELAAGCIDS